MSQEAPVSPYLKRPLRSVEQVLRERSRRRRRRIAAASAPEANNSNHRLLRAKSA
jgi:hypothetical protein